MNIIADNSINPELIGNQAWFGKIADTLADNYVNPSARTKQIQKTKGFVQDALSWKPLDRKEVRTKELLIDGQAYDQHYEPFGMIARNMWSDIEAYQAFGDAGHIGSDLKLLNVNIEGS